jgi:hypothetical protein
LAQTSWNYLVIELDIHKSVCLLRRLRMVGVIGFEYNSIHRLVFLFNPEMDADVTN